jgi:hypothetical protein
MSKNKRGRDDEPASETDQEKKLRDHASGIHLEIPITFFYFAVDYGFGIVGKTTPFRSQDIYSFDIVAQLIINLKNDPRLAVPISWNAPYILWNNNVIEEDQLVKNLPTESTKKVPFIIRMSDYSK